MAQLTYRESVSLAIAQAMRKDPKVFFIGEDVGAAGGVFKATVGLLDEFGKETFYDRYYDEQLFVDVNATYKIGDYFNIFASATNLTNQELRYYQGRRANTMQAEYYGPRINLGVKWNLF